MLQSVNIFVIVVVVVVYLVTKADYYNILQDTGQARPMTGVTAAKFSSSTKGTVI